MELVEVDRGAGAVVRLHGPLGVRRTVRTQVLGSEPPHALHGEAHVGARTRAVVDWSIQDDSQGSRVTLTARPIAASAVDRALLVLGGRMWMRRHFVHALDQLATRFDTLAAPADEPAAEAVGVL